MARYLITSCDARAPRRETQETAYWSLSWVKAFDSEARAVEVFDAVVGEPISVAELKRRAQNELDELGIEERL